VDGKVRLTLDSRCILMPGQSHDAVQIRRRTPLDCGPSNGGVAGDQATVAALVTAAPALLHAPPGLLA